MIFTCPACSKRAHRTQHHVFPRRFYNPRHKANRVYIYLCRPCHDQIERIIAEEEEKKGGQLTASRYVAIAQEFLEGGDNASQK